MLSEWDKGQSAAQFSILNRSNALGLRRKRGTLRIINHTRFQFIKDYCIVSIADKVHNHSSIKMIIEYAVASVRGSDSETNTDQYILCQGTEVILKGGMGRKKGTHTQSGLLLSLCDGIDGKEGLACAQSSMNEFVSLLEGINDVHSFHQSDGVSRLGDGMRRIHELLLQLTEIRDDDLNMIACISAVWFCRDSAVYSHVGNTRIYRFVDSVLELLTEDHTEAWSLVKEGKITPEKVNSYPGHKILTQVLGGKAKQKPEFEIHSQKIERNDTFLICTNGLTDGITDREIESMLTNAIASDGRLNMDVLDEIMDQSVKNGGNDHSTAILCQVFPDESLWTAIIRSLDDK